LLRVFEKKLGGKMPLDREFPRQVAQYEKETTEGTAVATTKRHQSVSFMLDIGLDLQPYKPVYFRRSTRVDLIKKWAGVKVDGKPSYTLFPTIFNCLYKKVAPTTPGGSAPRDWLWEQSTIAPETIDTLTIEKGDHIGIDRATGCFFTGWSMSGSETDISFSAEGMGRAVATTLDDAIHMSTREVQTIDLSGGDDPTGGTFTITVLGQTTSALAYNASAAAVQAAINLLPATGAGDITVSLAGFVYTLYFPYYLGNVSAVTVGSGSLTTGGSITVTIATTTGGVAASEVADRPLIPTQVSWYADTTSGGLGGTLLTRVLDWSISDSGNRELFWTVNRANAGAAAGKADSEAPSMEISLTVEADAAGMAFYTKAKAGTSVYLRFEALDAADSIESSYGYQAIFDFHCKVKGISEYKPTQNLHSYTVTFEVCHDASWGSGKAMSLANRNASTAI
jgi:hypothetical protein